MQDEDDLSFAIPTYRLRDVGETVEQYDEHFWRNGHSPQIIVFDDPTPTNQEKYFPLIEQTKTHHDLYYVGPREKEQFLAYLNCRLRDRRLESLVKSLFRPSYGGKSQLHTDVHPGSVDATPLFVHLASAYYKRTGDCEFVEEIWPNIEAALNWMHRYGDRDGDGFLEYNCQSRDGLVHQGWKDSDDAIFHADGSLARRPIAVCEVQGYAYAAWHAAAVLAAALGRAKESADFLGRAETLQARFDNAFWRDELGTYAVALDGDKRPCRVRTSNAGQCLFSGIVPAERAALLAQTLLAPESFSGWGIRTVAASEPRYNPMGYHNGGVWPHDNVLIACGLARYGMAEEASRIFVGLFDTAMYLDLHRVPELFCGFTRDPGEGPILYPVACAPQAWSAASVFLLFQASLGLTIDGIASKITFVRPWLPPFLNEARILNLKIAEACVDLAVVRHEHDVSGKVLRRRGDVEVVVAM